MTLDKVRQATTARFFIAWYDSVHGYHAPFGDFPSLDEAYKDKESYIDCKHYDKLVVISKN